MKSIKEKAKEHGLEYPGIRCSNDDIYKDCDKPSMDFEAGANYVLGEVERIVKYYKDPHCIEFLKEVIWRLKEE